MKVEANSLLGAALTYAASGLAVVPLYSAGGNRCDCARGTGCGSPGKHPRTEHGLSDATTDPRRIAMWWSRWSSAGVGVAVPPLFAVIDVDDYEAFEELERIGIALPETLVAATPRGWHYWYRTRRPVRPRVGVLPHLDLRGPGSYVVVFPTPGYRWLTVPHAIPYVELR